MHRQRQRPELWREPPTQSGQWAQSPGQGEESQLRRRGALRQGGRPRRLPGPSGQLPLLPSAPLQPLL